MFYQKLLLRDCCSKFATGLKCLNRHYTSDQALLLPKWFTHKGITLAKGQLGHSYTFWTMSILTLRVHYMYVEGATLKLLIFMWFCCQYPLINYLGKIKGRKKCRKLSKKTWRTGQTRISPIKLSERQRRRQRFQIWTGILFYFNKYIPTYYFTNFMEILWKNWLRIPKFFDTVFWFLTF